MKAATVVINIVLFLFTCLVLVTDGLPKAANYIVFTVWILLTPILSIVVISLTELSKNLRIGAITCNVIFLGFICWTLVDQYPHPDESGFIEYVILLVLAPIISIVALTRKRKLNNSMQAHAA